VTGSPVLGKVREQFADLEQSSFERRHFFGSSFSFKIRVDRKKPPPPGELPVYYVPSSRLGTVCKRTPLEESGTNPSMWVLLHTVLVEGT